MTEHGKRVLAAVFLIAALACASVGFAMWGPADDDAQHDRNVAEIEVGLGMRGVDTNVSADHTPSIVLFALGGLGLVCGVVLLASSKPEREPQREESPAPT